jgi:hypothetical protein
MATFPAFNPASPIGAGFSGINPAGFSQPDRMIFMSQLFQNLGSLGGGVATNYLAQRGSFSSAPLEQGVKVRQADENAYFEALGYNMTA